MCLIQAVLSQKSTGSASYLRSCQSPKAASSQFLSVQMDTDGYIPMKLLSLAGWIAGHESSICYLQLGTCIHVTDGYRLT